MLSKNFIKMSLGIIQRWTIDTMIMKRSAETQLGHPGYQGKKMKKTQPRRQTMESKPKMPTPCPEITLYNPCYPRGYLQEKRRNMINKNARYVGQIPIYEHFQKRSRINGAPMLQLKIQSQMCGIFLKTTGMGLVQRELNKIAI